MIAEAILKHLPALDNSCFEKAETAGPGFINLFLAPAFWAGVVLAACSNDQYGQTDLRARASAMTWNSSRPTPPAHAHGQRPWRRPGRLPGPLFWSGQAMT